MESYADTYYWIRFGAVVVVAVIAVVAALRRSRAKAQRRDLAYGVLGVVALVAAIVLTGAPVNWLLTAGLLVVGVVLGYVAAGTRALSAWLGALALVFAVIMGLFGAVGAVAFGLSVFGFGAGLTLGQGVRGMISSPAPEIPVAAPPASEV